MKNPSNGQIELQKTDYNRVKEQSTRNLSETAAMRQLADDLLAKSRHQNPLGDSCISAMQVIFESRHKALRQSIPLLASLQLRERNTGHEAALRAILHRTDFRNEQPVTVVAQLERLLQASENGDDPDAETLRRYIIAVRHELGQASMPGVKTISAMLPQIQELDTAALANADLLASAGQAGTELVIANLVRDGVQRRREWTAASLASGTALEIFQRLEARLPATLPWWNRPHVWQLILAAGLSLLAGVVLAWMIAGRRPVAKDSTKSEAASADAEQTVLTPPPVIDVSYSKAVVIHTSEDVAFDTAIQKLIHRRPERQENDQTPAPEIRTISYRNTPAAAQIPAGLLVSPRAELLLGGLASRNMLAGVDAAIVVRPIGDSDAYSISVLALPAPLAKEAAVPGWSDSPAPQERWRNVWAVGMRQPVDYSTLRRKCGRMIAANPAQADLVAEAILALPDTAGDDLAFAAAACIAANRPDLQARGLDLLRKAHELLPQELGISRLLVVMEGAEARKSLVTMPELASDAVVRTFLASLETPTAAESRQKLVGELTKALLMR